MQSSAKNPTTFKSGSVKRNKVILTAILSILTFASFYILAIIAKGIEKATTFVCELGKDCILEGNPNSVEFLKTLFSIDIIIFYILALPTYLIFHFGNSLVQTPLAKYISVFVMVILQIAYLYVLSCLIVFIYKKIKKKEEKKIKKEQRAGNIKKVKLF